MRLEPCLAALPHGLRGRAGVELARSRARQALSQCAEQAHLPAAELSFPRDAERAPLPMPIAGSEWHWSTTNTKGLVAAILAPLPVGIDAEWLGRARLEVLAAYLPSSELSAMPQAGERAQLALWSAKESVIKLTGIGMAAMGRTHLQMAFDPEHLALNLDGKLYHVQQAWQPEHVLSVACELPHGAQGFELELCFLAQEESLQR